MKKVILILVACIGLSTASLAVEPDEILADPALEERAREISRNLRCLVCQNENIDSSHAVLAKDLRVLVRERLMAGDSDEEVFAFLVDRYGDFVLLTPPVQSNTLILWLAPFLFMGAGALGLFIFLRSGSLHRKENLLSDEEQAQIDDLLK